MKFSAFSRSLALAAMAMSTVTGLADAAMLDVLPLPHVQAARMRGLAGAAQFRGVDALLSGPAGGLVGLQGVGRALWTTLRIATLGTVLAAVLALPLGLLAARNLHAPRVLSLAARALRVLSS